MKSGTGSGEPSLSDASNSARSTGAAKVPCT